MKVKEDRKGLPLGYVPPTNVSEEVEVWLNFDRGFVNAIFFLKHVQ
jgi:hypothetical protein